MSFAVYATVRDGATRAFRVGMREGQPYNHASAVIGTSASAEAVSRAALTGCKRS